MKTRSISWKESFSSSLGDPGLALQLSLIFHALCLFASIHYLETASTIPLLAAHLWLAISVAVLVFFRLLKGESLRRVFASPALFLLIAFLAYFLFRTLTHEDGVVRSNYLKLGFGQIAVGLVTGILTFGGLGSSPVKRAKGSSFENVALVFVSIVLLWVSFRVFGRLHDKFFVVYDQISPYQMFGTYQVCLIISLLLCLKQRFEAHALTDVQRVLRFGFFIWLLVLLSIFLGQAIGSNLSPLIIGLFGTGLALREIFQRLRREHFRRLNDSARVLIRQIVVATLVMVSLIAVLNPMRIFNFKTLPIHFWSWDEKKLGGPGGAGRERPVWELAGSSVESRVGILSEGGLRQFSHRPLFGDLATEIAVGNPGRYIHSVVSVQTHLGLVGSLLLLGFLVLSVRNLVKGRAGFDIRSTVLLLILMAALFSFFTWLPLWFAVGALCSFEFRRARGSATI